MQTAKQISITLANKPGRLAAVLDELSTAKVNIRALVVMDSGERGRVRFLPDNLDKATDALDRLNVSHEVADVLLVEVPNQPGGFGRLCHRLAAEHLNIDYAYLSTSPALGARRGALAIIRVNDLAKAQRVLGDFVSHNHREKPHPGRRPVHAR